MAGWTRSIGRHWPRRLAVPAIAVAGLAWWWGPALTGRGDGTDVLVVGNGDVSVAEQPLARRLREQGISVEVAEPPAGWCAVASTIAADVAAVDPRVVVVGLRDVGSCEPGAVDRALDALVATGVDVVVVTQPGTAEEAVRTAAGARGLLIADPARLLGDGPLPRSARCEWWDDPCPLDGQVEVRDVTGRLTSAGIQRLARVVAAEIR